MARPQGEIRQVLRDTVARLVLERGPVTCREVAAVAQVGFEAARRTMNNMLVAGELHVSGKEKPAGSIRWHNLYELAETQQDELPLPWAGIEALADVVKGWPGA